MKKFTFTLEKARQWREKQLDIEEARLQQLIADKALVERSRDLLEQEAGESAALVCNTALEATDLRAIDAFRRYVLAQRGVFAAKLAECDQRIAAQQGNILEARRKYELLQKLKNKKWGAWNTDLAREMESQAGELFLAKWKSPPR